MPFEFAILNWIQEHMRSELLDKLMVCITSLGEAGILWIVLTIVFLCYPKMRKVGMVLALSLICDYILCNLVLKPLVARIRPYDVYTGVQLLVSKLTDYSFPSGHTAASFAVTTALYLQRQKLLWRISLILSILIAFSRLYLYVHFPTDIAGGILVGIICGWMGYQISGKINRFWEERKS